MASVSRITKHFSLLTEGFGVAPITTTLPLQELYPTRLHHTFSEINIVVLYIDPALPSLIAQTDLV